MEGYLTQILGDLGFEELYWSKCSIEEEIIKTAYSNWRTSQEEVDFEEYWNAINEEVKIERVFVDEIYV